MTSGTILCLGDGLTSGVGSEYGRGYPEELARLLSDHLNQSWTCLNHGISDEVSTDLLRRTFPIVHSFAALPGPKLACLLAGTNDSMNPAMPVDLYRDNIQQIIRIFQRHNIKLLLGIIPPVKEPQILAGDRQKSSIWIEEANQAIRELAAENHLVIVDFSDMEKFLVDDVHFGYSGYLEMARRWFEQIKELRRVKQPVISIIGTIFNQAKLAERTLDIWCRQNFDLPYEIIILDDGSTDHTRSMVAEYQSEYPNLIRYYYFDEPNLIRNCTLLFNTAIKKLMRSEIALIQMFDRIPSTLDALKLLYEPHLQEDRIVVSFLSRHIAGSSSREVINDDSVDKLLGSVAWREDPLRLSKIMGHPGPHCHPNTMNESPCFTVKKRHLEELNGYDERYYKVANYSNIELYGRLRHAGFRIEILDHYTFHQPHPANRDDMQNLIEPETVIKRNQLIRQNWGSIMPDDMVSENERKFTIVVDAEGKKEELLSCFSSSSDLEVLVEANWNDALRQASGQYLIFASLPINVFPDLKQILHIYRTGNRIGCIGNQGGAFVERPGGFSVKSGQGLVAVATGPFFCFPRRPSIANGLEFLEKAEPLLREIDFSLQMRVWGGRNNVSLGNQPVDFQCNSEQFCMRWSFLQRMQGDPQGRGG